MNEADPEPDSDIERADAELQPVVDALRRQTVAGGLPTLEGLAEVRRQQPVMPPLERPRWHERTIDGPGGALRLVVVEPDGTPAGLRPAVLHTHGGGFVAGSVEAALPILQTLAQALGCVLVSVDYRLAPEAQFPAALEDNYAALKWLHGQALALGVDPARIALLGESAGGGHAAMLAIAARDRGEIAPAFLALVYPMLDDRTASTRAVPPHIGRLLWTPELNRFGWSCLLGQPAGGAAVPAAAVPARNEDLRGLPPTFVAVGTLDLFLREDVEFALRLAEAGVAAELLVLPGAFHAFDVIVPQAAVSQRLHAALVQALARGLAPAAA